VTFIPRGSTALLDVMGRTIVDTGSRLSSLSEEDRPDNVIFVIVTDGHENASREFTASSVFDMVKHQTENYSWNFVYLGANQDAIAVGASLGIRRGSSISYSATAAGTSSSYNSTSSLVKDLRTGATSASFSAIDRKNASL